MVDKIMQAYIEMEPKFNDSFYVLRECLSELRGKSKTAIELRYGRHMPSQDIATSMKLSDGAIRVLLNRTRTSLKRCLRVKSTV